MAKNGLLIDYENCTGCYGCVVACIQEHDYPQGKSGMMINEMVTGDAEKVHIGYIVFPTDLCDLCEKRVSEGKDPACVKHCQASCIYFGQLVELAGKMKDITKSALFAPAASMRAANGGK